MSAAASSGVRVERVLRALDELRAGRMVVLVDDEDRENEGDICLAAEKVTPEAINFMARHARGLICLTMTEERVAQLGLSMMCPVNRANLGTAFTVSIEARHGVTTGISAHDRATTIRAAVAVDAHPEDIVSPGHVFPLKARPGGVLVRTGQTEGSVDLARLAGLEPAGVICEIMRDDGQMARLPDLERFAAEHGLLLLFVADIIEYRLLRERLVHRVAEGVLRPPLAGGFEFKAAVYESHLGDAEYLALYAGDLDGGEPPLVRVQAMCPVGDVFGGGGCECEAQLRAALRAIAAAGRGALIYVHTPGQTSLAASFRAHVLHQAGAGGAGALRDFGLGAQVLADLGARRIRLLSCNPKKLAGLAGFGLEVVEHVPLATRSKNGDGWPLVTPEPSRREP